MLKLFLFACSLMVVAPISCTRGPSEGIEDIPSLNISRLLCWRSKTKPASCPTDSCLNAPVDAQAIKKGCDTCLRFTCGAVDKAIALAGKCAVAIFDKVGQ